ncbi:hypothetical protein BMR1_01G00997 [Babesia microti strain RI]|uniref:Uncharacterized protein n=1 Tax=Babesia microti (strain RI) TaxID=1133968 RepID=A0A1N6LWI9_BABMR|nr:hypothetical protein BMR1_01G00997 [Babesia microti strain RI]SIO73235.1 hypothetical protein BMR1_01G00997 [Babesia microti strain RI]|eukprot:XP_021337342.1 hypothetical protein BMR1_01G00997 [Babesia microti strain RI]
MTIQANDHGPPQNKLGYKLLVNCLREHGNDIASKITQMRDKDMIEEGIQVFESIGQKELEPIQSREIETHKVSSFPSSVNKELFSKLKELNNKTK